MGAGYRVGLALLALAAVVPAPVPTAPAQPEPHQRARLDPAALESAYAQLVAGLMSPFCLGRTLEDCPTSAAAQVRAQIRAWLQQGRSQEWIRDRLRSEYGDVILGEPPLEGFGWVAWLALPLVVLAGGAAVLRVLRAAGSATAEAPAADRERPRGPSRDRADGQDGDRAAGLGEELRSARARVEAELAELELL